MHSNKPYPFMWSKISYPVYNYGTMAVWISAKALRNGGIIIFQKTLKNEGTKSTGIGKKCFGIGQAETDFGR